MSNQFSKRHIGPNSEDVQQMLGALHVSSIDQLIEQTIPSAIRLKQDLDLAEGMTEFDYSKEIIKVGAKNKVLSSYIGMGYSSTITPAVISRNVLENPGWYTSYTPYQAEISQGRLEGLLNYQTVVSDLTALPIANCSLLDEATAAAEAMIMLYNCRSRRQVKAGVNTFFISKNCFPQTIEVVEGRAKGVGINLIIANENELELTDDLFGIVLQYPDTFGNLTAYNDLVETAHKKDIKVAVATDLMSLTLLTPPGEWGADIAFGNSQRFGVPLGFGGPHAAFFACKEAYKRNMPGRIIGVSVDANGNAGLRMALQTREQHIRREKATSNICTAQALLAIMAGMYAVYHGAEGVKNIATDIHQKANTLNAALQQKGLIQTNKVFFDTLSINADEATKTIIKSKAETAGINLNYHFDNKIIVSVGETATWEEITTIATFFDTTINVSNENKLGNLARTSSYLTHSVFSKYHSETEMMRYLKRLENKDISLTNSMISLGSCTMKLNAATELYPISNPNFANIHPYAPTNQTEGYTELINDFEKWLCTITGFTATSFQPNSGAQGEYTGLLTIKQYHIHNNEEHRNIILIPSSAHGTNPASCIAAGFKVVIVKCDEKGNVDVVDLKEKADLHQEKLAGLMITYPSTHGVFETAVIEIVDYIHAKGGLVYMDGANMNAQVGLTNPGSIGADVCHLNLHKTFAIPHGGGGPGMGPICVNEKLAKHLPKNHFTETDTEKINPVTAANYGSALILLISYGYVKMLGKQGLKAATQTAILNANYMKSRLEKHFDILYTNNNGRVAHEMILDCRGFKQETKVEVGDIGKRLIDYGFHAPTISFPVHDTLMIEPTESESLYELDRFCDALIAIKAEINQIAAGTLSKEDNPLKNAPHTIGEFIAEKWKHSYSKSVAAYPIEYLKTNKYWTPVARIDDAAGDRNLVCNCVETTAYSEEPIMS